MISYGRHRVVNCEVRAGIVTMELHAPDIAAGWRAGQFVNMYPDDRALMLPRPISICKADVNAGTITLVFRVAGSGTEMFSRSRTGDTLMLMGPLGNGFPLDEEALCRDSAKAVLVGGGIGIPPLLGLGMTIRSCFPGATVVSCLGYRDEAFMLNHFHDLGDVIVSTENGILGHRGYIVGHVPICGADAIYACGPLSMMRALAGIAAEKGALNRLYVSVEERMACGLGACMGCAVKKDDGHYDKVCADGPVFAASAIAWGE